MQEPRAALKKIRLNLRRGTSRLRNNLFPSNSRFLLFLTLLGPGIIAANAGNDAGGIATFASVGADYGYKLLWTFIPLTIGLCVVQEMCARMGVITGKGLSDLIREQFGVRITTLVMIALIIANSGVTISEFIGIGLSLEIFGIPRFISVPLAAGLIWWLIIKGSYERVEKIFLAMSLVFFGYIISAFLSKPEWLEVGKGLTYPTIETTPTYIFTIVAVIGTTISPYMQVFVQSSVAEKELKPENYSLTRIDSIGGSIFSMMVAFFIVVSTAATLNLQGVHIETAADAARALEPLAGRYASVLFAVGLFGASMLAAGVLPLATAYSVSEAIGSEKGLSRTFQEAPLFSGTFTLLVIVGAAVAIIPGIPQIKLLLVTQCINGILLPILLVAIVLLCSNREVMGEFKNTFTFNCIAWAVTIIVSCLSLLLIYNTLFG